MMMPYAKKKRRLLVSAIVLFVAVLAGGIFLYLRQPVVEAADPDTNVYISPNSESMTKLKFTLNSNDNYTTAPVEDASSPNTEIISHILRHEPAGDIMKVDAAAYFNDKSQASYFALTGGICYVYNKDFGATDKAFIMVTIKYQTASGTQDYFYPIHAYNVCGDYDATNPVVNSPNATNSQTGTKNNNKQFYANYSIPQDFKNNALSDAATGGLYKLSISIAYMSGVHEGSNDGAGQQQVRFKIELPQCDYAAGCRRYIAPVAAGGSNRNYSTIRLGLGNAQKFYTTQRFEFGLPCTTTTPATNQNVNFFDIDNSVDWDDDYLGSGNGLTDNRVAMYIEKSTDGGETWTRLVKKPGEITSTFSSSGGDSKWYEPGDSGYQTFVWGPGAVLRGSTVRAETDTIRITMQPHTRYRAVITPAHTMNLLGVGLPYDSIYGLISCDTGVTGSIEKSATDGSLGDIVDFSFFGNRNQNFQTIDSKYTYSTKVWYETTATGAAQFNAGETAIAACDSTNVAVTHAYATGAKQLLRDCNNITINTPTARLCASLTLVGEAGTEIGTPNPVVTCIYIGKYPALQVQNGDIRVGGSFSTSGGVCNVPKAVVSASNPYGVLMHTYSTARGSYGWYAATSPGIVSQYGSMGNVYSNTAAPDRKKLLFGTGGFNSYGADDNGYFLGSLLITNYATADKTSHCLPNMAAMYRLASGATQAVPGSAVSLVNLTNRTYTFAGNNGALHLTGGTLAKSQQTVLHVTQNNGATGNNIWIDSSVAPPNGAYGSIDELPQLVIIAEGPINIHFASGVTAVYGVYSTEGNIYTCDSYDGNAAPKMSTATCNQQLTVNGTLIAQGRVLPFRTAGFDNIGDTTPAEIFNLSAETILSNYDAAAEQPIITVKYQYELPSRL